MIIGGKMSNNNKLTPVEWEIMEVIWQQGGSPSVRDVLEQLAPEVYLPPTDASLRLEGDRFVAVPSQPGRMLDVEAALGQVMTAFEGLGTDSHIALPFEPVPPQIADATAAQAQAEEMLSRQITISAYDTAMDESLAWTLTNAPSIGESSVESTTVPVIAAAAWALNNRTTEVEASAEATKPTRGDERSTQR